MRVDGIENCCRPVQTQSSYENMHALWFWFGKQVFLILRGGFRVHSVCWRVAIPWVSCCNLTRWVSVFIHCAGWSRWCYCGFRRLEEKRMLQGLSSCCKRKTSQWHILNVSKTHWKDFTIYLQDLYMHYIVFTLNDAYGYWDLRLSIGGYDSGNFGLQSKEIIGGAAEKIFLI